MAYSITRQSGDDYYNLVELAVDSRDDINSIPTSYLMGSTCICISDSSVWMLGSDKVWHEI